MEEALAGVPEVAGVYLFGSALGLCRPDSDLDLAIILPPEQTRTEKDRELWEVKLYDRLRRFENHPVDLTIFDPGDTLFSFRILSEGRPLLIRDPDLLGEYRERVSRRHFEVYYRYRQAVAEVLGAKGGVYRDGP